MSQSAPPFELSLSQKKWAAEQGLSQKQNLHSVWTRTDEDLSRSSAVKGVFETNRIDRRHSPGNARQNAF